MAKSTRINLSVPKPLYDVFVQMGELTGQGTAAAMVQALALQSAYARRWIQHFNFVPREARGSQIEDRAGVVGSIPPPAPFDPEFEDGGLHEKRPLTRQERRQLEREERKRRR